MVRLCPNDNFSVYQSLLATGAVLFNRSDLKAKASTFDDKSRWLLGDSAASRFAEISPDTTAVPRRRAFPEGGYYILGEDFESPREVRIVADTGPLGYLSIAAHGHADALSFTLSVAGHELLIDPGTYAYHTDQKWRDYFRGTSAHNTLQVDRVDQSVSGGTFMWTHHAKSRCERFEISDRLQVLSATQDGYHRLGDPVIHKRDLRYEPKLRFLRVEDHIDARGPHHVEIFWHLSEKCSVKMHEHFAVVQSGGVTMKLTWPFDTAAQLVRAEDSPRQGWISRGLDSKSPAYTLVVSRSTQGSWRGVSTLEIRLPRDMADAP
jgi:uncharacterized heparinase superfamily protein